MTKQILSRRQVAVSTIAGTTVAIWVVAAITIVKTAQSSFARTGELDIRTPVTLAVGMVSLFLLLFILKIPSGLRARILHRSFPHSLILNASANTAVRAQFSAPRFGEMVDNGRQSLAFSFTFLTDNEGISFWIGFIEPSRFALVPWTEIAAIGMTSRQVLTERIPMLQIENMHGGKLSFNVNQAALFGLFRRGERSTEKVVEQIRSHRPPH
jgi:hypothetical protein